uniref:Uncharacterized protein n=1 Tax=Glossina palpalis gambiensis TaxID=67801 RepID=A0A1B0BVN5_9MUSC
MKILFINGSTRKESNRNNAKESAEVIAINKNISLMYIIVTEAVFYAVFLTISEPAMCLYLRSLLSDDLPSALPQFPSTFVRTFKSNLKRSERNIKEYKAKTP